MRVSAHDADHLRVAQRIEYQRRVGGDGQLDVLAEAAKVFDESRQRAWVDVVFGLFNADELRLGAGVQRRHQRQHAQCAAGHAYLVDTVLKTFLLLHEVEAVVVFRQPRFDGLGQADDGSCRFEDALSRVLVQSVQRLAKISPEVIESGGFNAIPVSAQQEGIGIEEAPAGDELRYCVRRKRRIR